MKVYIELLFLDNLLMNFIILYFSGRFARIRFNFARELAGAAAGGCYACFMFAYEGFLSFILIKIAVSLIMCLAAFYKKKRFKACLKSVIYFYVNTLVLGGAAFAFLSLSSQNYMIKGGIIVGTSAIRYVLCGLFAAILIIALFRRIYRVNVQKQLFYDIVVEFMGKTVTLSAYLDTGNSLREPLSGLPVIIAEKSAVSELLPEKMKQVMEEGEILGENEAWFTKLRVLPCKGIMRKNETLFGFKPDAVRLLDEKGTKELMAIIAVTDDILNDTGMYHVLLGPESLA